MPVGSGLQGVGKWLVVNQNMELSFFHEVAEMTEGQVHCQQFPIEGTVFQLCRLQLVEEVRNGSPVAIDELL